MQLGVAGEHVELVEQAHERVIRPAGQPGVDRRAEPVARVVEGRDGRVALVAEPLDACSVRLDEEGVEVLVVVEHRAPAQAGLLRDIRQRQRAQAVLPTGRVGGLDECGPTCFLSARPCHVLDTTRRPCHTSGILRH